MQAVGMRALAASAVLLALLVAAEGLDFEMQSQTKCGERSGARSTAFEVALMQCGGSSGLIGCA